MNKKKVAVVVPFHKEELSDDEKLSLRHVRRFLGGYDKFLVVSDGIRVPAGFEDFSVKLFSAAFFSDKFTYSVLLLSPKFYKIFGNYEYILVYQLDALVFSVRLPEFYAKGYDYIGAPWLKDEIENYWWAKEDAVGNGGFSLRKVCSCRKVLNAYYSRVNARARFLAYLLACLLRCVKQGRGLHFAYAKKFRSVGEFLRYADYKYCAIATTGDQIHEDIFWSVMAKKFYDFKIAPVEVALNFSFECAPMKCFQRNGQRLPFGCHAFDKWDRKFWEPFFCL